MVTPPLDEELRGPDRPAKAPKMSEPPPPSEPPAAPESSPP